MSNTSYQIKENSNVMKVQGGEQKVMKKILSVALSTAMAFSMFASVAFGDSAVSVQDKYDSLKAKGIFTGYPDGSAHLEKDMTRAEFAKVVTKLLGLKEVTGTLSYKDKGYDAKNWAVPYIEAVTAAGIMEGQDKEKKIFNYNGKVTVQEMATVLTRALKLEIPANPDNSASAWAKGYVQAAIDKGLISKDANFQANATRSQLVEAAYAIDQAQNPAVASYKVADNGKDVEFTLNTGEVVKVTLDKALEPNKETEVKFKNAAGQEITTKVTWAVTAATKVQSASASNYKELVVKFDGEVDAKTAENVDNYKVTGVSFESATLSSDKTSVTLLVKDGSGTLPKQKDTKLEVKGVKNSTGSKTFNETVTFRAVDTALPEIKEAKALGTKAFKVEFSEPVTSATATNISNYKVDGKAISGYVQFTSPNIAFITTNLSVGEHTLTVSGVEDFAGFKVSPADTKFTVAEDTAAPEIVSVKTSDLNKVVVEFNEPVKSVDKAYHTTSSKTADKIEIKDNKVTLSFTGDNKVLSLGETTVYLQGVKDWSDNSANREAKVTPQLDTERPTATSVTSEVYQDSTKFTIDFSKDVRAEDITNADNFVLKNSKGEVVVGKGFNTKGHPVKAPYYEVKNGNVNKSRVIIDSVGKLDAGKYTLEISGIRDTAYIGNTMLPQSFEVDVTNTSELKVNGVWADVTSDADDAYIDVTFNKELALDGAGKADDINKYSYVVGTTYKPFPAKSTTISLRDAKTVRITVAKKDINTAELLNSELRVTNVADKDGNFITASQTKVNDQATATIGINSVKATALNKVVVEFDGIVSYVNQNDFKFNGSTAVASAPQYDGNTTTVTFTLSKDLDPQALGNFETVEQPTSSDAYGHKVAKTPSTGIKDGIAPKAVKATTAVGATYVDITFNEEVSVYYTPGSFKVYVNGNGADVKGATTLADKHVIRVELDKAVPTDAYSVQVSATNSGNNIQDKDGNNAEAIDLTAFSK
ncbi:S-layer homology domain-containing protein [Paenibacillus sp. KQZ6P-2]|uniref:S-layer homology domain-containing protein n=1 Tax=Paenibacillus mangrovi TaxID=2931978 RepID=A0A9X1WP08_9BACL|nr:S-layer homology domain-containing protein [Paenibacillus mangrovi]MCJ8012772.1 S-layer homology domain-containing protein [Paenibacillus mangrovi]